MNPKPSEPGKESDPKRGEVWYVDFDPSVGKEQRKKRPAVVVSVAAVGRLPLRIVVPITSTMRDDAVWLVPLKASASNGLGNDSSADAFQVKSVSLERFDRRIGVLSADEVKEITAAVVLCLGFEPERRGIA